MPKISFSLSASWVNFQMLRSSSSSASGWVLRAAITKHMHNELQIHFMAQMSYQICKTFPKVELFSMQ